MTILRSAFAGGAMEAALALSALALSALALSALALSACGGGDDKTGSVTGSGGAGTASTGTSGETGGAGGAGGVFVPGMHPALPQVVNLGGQVLKSPKVQLIRYASEPKAADLDAFLKEMTTSPYWSEVTSQYGVGPLTVLPTIERPEQPPATLADSVIQSDLATNTSGASPAWGAADPSTIYLFVMPPGTIVDAGGDCCQDFDGYHDEDQVGATSLAYAVVCSCGGPFDGLGKTAADNVAQVTIAASHEMVEASTDPFVQTAPAFGQTDDDDIVWTIGAGGELADMCEFNQNSFVVPTGAKYTVQQSWSNAAAKLSQDPCVPVKYADPYFSAIAVMPDTLKINGIPSTKAVKLAVGMTATIDVELFSDGPLTGPFKVTAYDFSSFIGGSPNLELTLSPSTGNNGDTLKLTIKVLKIDQDVGADPFFLQSTLGKDASLSMGLVGI